MQAPPSPETPTDRSPARPGLFASWPLVWRLPIVMALVVLVFAIVLTNLGLQQLERQQSEVRQDIGGAFLDTLAGVVAPALDQGAEASDLERLLQASARFKPSLRNEAVGICCLTDGATVLYSSYEDAASGVRVERVTEVALSLWLDANRELETGTLAVDTVDETAKLLMVQAYPLEGGGRFLLGAAFDLEWQRAEQLELRRTALVVDVILSLLAALLTFMLARYSLKPIDELTEALDGNALDQHAARHPSGDNTEIGRLHKALKSRAELQAKAEALAKSENKHAREATLARLAAGLAHEVRNPVAGMSAAASTLRRYGEDQAVRDQTIDLIERGLQSIDHVAASMLSTYRPPEGNRDLEPSDLEDLKTLVSPKVRVKQVDLQFNSFLETAFPTSAEAVRQMALNLLLNAIDATPAGSSVTFEARVTGEHLSICVADSGSGLPDEALSVLTDGGTANKPQTRRLGLWLVHQLIDDVNGRIAISTRSDAGTVITITIPKRASETGPDDG